MSHVNHVSDILATLQLLRADAESVAHQKHLQQHLDTERIHRLEHTRERVHDLLPDTSSPHLQSAYELSLRRAEIEWAYWAHRQALEQSSLETGTLADRCSELAVSKERQLSELPELPTLSLQEQEALLQALMCQAVEQYVDNAIAQVHELPPAA